MGFGASLLAWLTLAVLLTVRSRGRGIGRLLLVAVGVQIVWSAMMALIATRWHAGPVAVATVDALRTFAWTGFALGLLLAALRAPQAAALSDADRAVRIGFLLAAGIAALSSMTDLLALDAQAVFGSKLIASILGLVCIEQVYRNTPDSQRWAIKFLCLALAAMFGFDLALYSDALLFGAIDTAWWSTRGYANALLVPLVAVAAARNAQWKLDIAVSRGVVFHSAALLCAGLYLLAVAIAGYWLKFTGGAWGGVAQTMLVFTAVIGLVALASSDVLRARMRVFVAKNFFSYRYDYRDEWLRLTDLIALPGTGTTDDESLELRSVRGLARLVESPGGALWLRRDDGQFVPQGRWQLRAMPPAIAASEPLIRFIAQRQWLVDLDEYRSSPQAYDGLQLPTWLESEPDAWLIVPLLLKDDLIGFVQLQRPVAKAPVDWEVRDILKTSARQVAGYLAMSEAIEKLVQSRQFDSFNRMSAFVVHDLKNLVAQLSLMMKNAARHRDNPDFQQDMLSTVENVLDRMQGMLMQLRVGARSIEQPTLVRLTDAIRGALAAKKELALKPTLELDEGLAQVEVIAHADRLERVLGHLIQNAVEATSAGGDIQVIAHRSGKFAIIEVRDSGRGMSREFIETRLFKPFTSTKPHGMGIGTFESREYVHEIGGTLTVASTEGIGTTFTVRLPLQVAATPVAA